MPSSLASRTFTNAFVSCRTNLRDQTAQRYPDSFLLDFGAQAHGKLQELFASRDIPFGERCDRGSFSYTAAALPLATVSATATGSTATLVFGVDPTVSPYFYAAGDLVYVGGFYGVAGADTIYNGTFIITAVSSASKSISYVVNGTPASATSNGLTRTEDIINVSPNLTDMYEPLEVWCQIPGTQQWMWVNRVDRLDAPPVIPYQYLTQWEWSEGLIKVSPASNNMNILVRYSRQLAYPASASVMLGEEGFYWPLVDKVCELAARATSRPNVEASFARDYLASSTNALQRAVRQMQSIPARMGGYRSQPNRGIGSSTVRT